MNAHKMIVGDLPDIKQLKSWMSEAESAHSAWRKESWIDSLCVDGKQWTAADRQRMIDRSINPLTINRIFPVINLIAGNFAANQHDIMAVGRTTEDSEVSQVMSEAIAFVMDQYGGYDMVFNAFQNALIPGFGCLGVGLNNDPRKEKVSLMKYPWYSVWYDPYGEPWMDPASSKYAYYADWKDMEAVAALHPEKAQELKERFADATSDQRQQTGYSGGLDEGTMIEEERNNQTAGGSWAQKQRKRIRPVEMWYTVQVPTWFADMGDGRVVELEKAGGLHEQFQMAAASNQCLCANVRKMRVSTFVGDMILKDQATPYPHDMFPFIPFIGYTDTFGNPYGVPRQVREMNMEVNKRRTMALALLSNRRVTMEEGTAEDKTKVYEEANRQDGLIILNDGKSETFQIEEMGQLAAPQMDMLMQSEREIQEITGANSESLGYKSGSDSAVALENKQQRSGMMTESLLKNTKRSQKMLGERIVSLVQENWTEPKVLRVTDRVTGAESFARLNEPVFNQLTGAIEIKNNMTQGRYDVTVSDRPMTDTVREKNMELIFSAIQKAPPEAIAPLLSLAFELSNMPNKDQLLHQLRMTLGVEPIDPLLTSAEADAKAAAQQQAKEEGEAADGEMIQRERTAELDKVIAETKKILAEAEAQLVGTQNDKAKVSVDASNAQTNKEKARTDEWEAGFKLRKEIEQNMKKEKEAVA